jgi:hypothetical protein
MANVELEKIKLLLDKFDQRLPKYQNLSTSYMCLIDNTIIHATSLKSLINDILDEIFKYNSSDDAPDNSTFEKQDIEIKYISGVYIIPNDNKTTYVKGEIFNYVCNHLDNRLVFDPKTKYNCFSQCVSMYQFLESDDLFYTIAKRKEDVRKLNEKYDNSKGTSMELCKKISKELNINLIVDDGNLDNIHFVNEYPKFIIIVDDHAILVSDENDRAKLLK